LTDLASYRLYRCAATPCLKTVGALLGTITAPATTFVLPHGQRGFLAVTAMDTSGNESVESNTVPFDLVAPAAPTGLMVQ
jgi:hypothetical protein